MIKRNNGGMVEFIPSPKEKRALLIQDHVLDLLANLDQRLHTLETLMGSPLQAGKEFRSLLAQIREEEVATQHLNAQLRAAGIHHQEETAV